MLGDLGVSTLMGDMRTNTRQTFSKLEIYRERKGGYNIF